jgi:hypothetical protein
MPRKGNSWPLSQFPHSCVCARFIYSIPTIGLPIRLQKNMWDRSWVYINRSQTHECGNWDWGCAISFLGMHKCDFRCSTVFATETVLMHVQKGIHKTHNQVFQLNISIEIPLLYKAPRGCVRATFFSNANLTSVFKGPARKNNSQIVIIWWIVLD